MYFWKLCRNTFAAILVALALAISLVGLSTMLSAISHAAMESSGSTASRAGNALYSQLVSKGQVKGLYSSTGANYYSPLTTGTGSNYQVPAGKKLICVQDEVVSQSASSVYQYGYADTAAPGSTSPPTTPIEVGYAPLWLPSGALVNRAIYFETPASKYPYVHAGGGSTTALHSLICIEVPQ